MTDGGKASLTLIAVDVRQTIRAICPFPEGVIRIRSADLWYIMTLRRRWHNSSRPWVTQSRLPAGLARSTTVHRSEQLPDSVAHPAATPHRTEDEAFVSISVLLINEIWTKAFGRPMAEG